MTSFIPCPVFAVVSQASLRRQFQRTDSIVQAFVYINHTRHWNVVSCTTLHPHSLKTVRTQEGTRQIRNALHISFFVLLQYPIPAKSTATFIKTWICAKQGHNKIQDAIWRMKEDWLHPVCIHSKKKKKKRRHIWSHLVHQIATSSMEQDSSQLLTQIAFADAISATQLWSCTARPESNKDEIWCSALGSPLMRGEGKLSEKHKTHPTSCLLALAGISSVRRARGWWVSGGGAFFLPVCPVRVSPIS